MTAALASVQTANDTTLPPGLVVAIVIALAIVAAIFLILPRRNFCFTCDRTTVRRHSHPTTDALFAEEWRQS